MSKAEDVAKLRSWNLISDGGSRQAGSGLSGFYLLCQIQVLEAKTTERTLTSHTAGTVTG